MARKIDAPRPLYAVVGAGDLAVEFARGYATDVQTRFAKVELEPKALRDQARTVVVARIDGLAGIAEDAQKQLEVRVADLQSDAKKLPSKVESYVNETVADVTETYTDLAVRGRSLVARIRKQQATADAKAAARTTTAKAKTARTQTAKSAKSTAGTAKKSATTTKAAAKKTGATAKSNAKSTTTAAKKTAAATTQAAGDATEKVGS